MKMAGGKKGGFSCHPVSKRGVSAAPPESPLVPIRISGRLPLIPLERRLRETLLIPGRNHTLLLLAFDRPLRRPVSPGSDRDLPQVLEDSPDHLLLRGRDATAHGEGAADKITAAQLKYGISRVLPVQMQTADGGSETRGSHPTLMPSVSSAPGRSPPASCGRCPDREGRSRPRPTRRWWAAAPR